MSSGSEMVQATTDDDASSVRSPKQWVRDSGPFGVNYVLDLDGFHISFNERPGGGFAFFESDDGGAETALVKGDDFFILNGDFRADYERLADGGFPDCYTFYLQNTDARSLWSDDEHNPQ